ncbi:AzlD domain-containing protein [Deinococcus yavapaiensis]|uniref:AzlD domain-containing protein n=1 Tax=Deinococcus yavapaiensis TaxID=309889 RepID=UPI000DA19437|nr:AzlD domain-containing protein [Deinococcus yavapaiensis]
MSDTLVILGMAVITYGTRFVGLRLMNLELTPFWLAFLRFVPISVFAALVVPSVAASSADVGARLLAAVGAGLVMWRTKQLWLGLLLGMSLFWLLRAWLVS